jgi:hypothetical protein
MIRSVALAVVVLLALSGCSDTGGPADGAATDIASPAGPDSRFPRLAVSADGTVWMSWLETAGEKLESLRAASLRGDRWSEPFDIAGGTDWFINWADFPSLIVGTEDFMAAHWLAKRPGGTYAYDVMMSVSNDGGRSWNAPFSPHDDGTATEHGFVSLYRSEVGFGAVWLDGRNMAANPDSSASGHEHGSGGMTLRAAMMDRDGRILQGTQIDDLTCDCCQTGAAMTAAGPLVVYRDRDGQEVRDIYFSAYRDGHWTPGRPVAVDGWQIAACPVNGPALAARDGGAVVGWFTGAPRPAVRAAFWSDADGTFTAAIDVDGDRPLGRVDSVLLPDGSAVISWLAATDDQSASIRYRRVRPDGVLGPIHHLAEVPAARSSGFPQMETGAQGLVFAWTIPGEPSQVRTATVPIPRAEDG